jgi:hypothetical protein
MGDFGRWPYFVTSPTKKLPKSPDCEQPTKTKQASNNKMVSGVRMVA